MNLKKSGFLLLIAGATLALALAAAGYLHSWPAGVAALATMVVGVALLATGMYRSGPRDEELPTAEIPPHGRRT